MHLHQHTFKILFDKKHQFELRKIMSCLHVKPTVHGTRLQVFTAMISLVVLNDYNH